MLHLGPYSWSQHRVDLYFQNEFLRIGTKLQFVPAGSKSHLLKKRIKFTKKVVEKNNELRQIRFSGTVCWISFNPNHFRGNRNGFELHLKQFDLKSWKHACLVYIKYPNVAKVQAQTQHSLRLYVHFVTFINQTHTHTHMSAEVRVHVSSRGQREHTCSTRQDRLSSAVYPHRRPQYTFDYMHAYFLHVLKYVYVRAYIFIYIYLQRHIYRLNRCTYVYTYIHTCIYTHIHKHNIYIYCEVSQPSLFWKIEASRVLTTRLVRCRLLLLWLIKKWRSSFVRNSQSAVYYPHRSEWLKFAATAVSCGGHRRVATLPTHFPWCFQPEGGPWRGAIQ